MMMVIVSTICLWWLLLVMMMRLLQRVWWTPSRVEAKMGSQGIRGPPYRLISQCHGDSKHMISHMRRRSQFMDKPITPISHNLFPRIQPHVYAWTKAYGKNFICWDGSKCQLFVTEAELVKEVLMNKEASFPKMDMGAYTKKLLGEALITNEGQNWAKVRKLANHTFHAHSLKSMVPEMSTRVAEMLEKWEDINGEIDVFVEFGKLTTEVISRTAFGSSYNDGKNIFEMVAKLTALTVRNMYKLRHPLISFLRTSDDEIEANNLAERIKSCILEKVREREIDAKKNGNLEDFGNDYLGQLLRLSHESDVKKRITTAQMIDEIKAIYGAGHLTTTSLLAWCVVLLGTNTGWQDKAREEVKATFGNINTPDSDGIARLKIMNMIINECLRLYPPVITLTRRVAKETKLGELSLTPDMDIFISILALHHSPQIWGRDAHLFNPERFSRGIAKATNNDSAAFLPFGAGPRTCVGLNFTTNEAKVALSMILQKYKFTLSPNYVHFPAEVFILTPKNGVQVILEKI